MLLFLPVLDHIKGYYPTFKDMLSHVPHAQTARIDEYLLGESQRAILDYYFSVRPRPIELGEEDAEYLLMWNDKHHTHIPDQESWTLLWEGTRPGERDGMYRLYRFK